MAIIRRHPTLFGSVGLCLIVAFAVTLNLSRHASLAVAKLDDPPGESYSPISPLAAAEIAQLRRDIALDDDALAAVNVTGQQAVNVIAAIRTWYEGHTAAFRAARSAVADQQALIRSYQSANTNGQDVIASLNAAKGDLPTLQAAYDSLIAECRSSALANLDNGQQTLATLLQTRKAIPMPYRAVSLSSEQDQTLQRLKMEFHLRYGSTSDPDAQAAALSQYGQAVANTLGTENVNSINSINANIPNASQYVVNAIQNVLAVDPNQ